MSILETALSGAAAVVLASGLSELTRRSANRRQDKADTRRVEAEAYERARQSYRDLVADLQAQVERLQGEAQRRDQASEQTRAEIDRLQTQVDEMRRLLRAEQGRSADLEHQVQELQQTVDRMRRLMREHDIEVPEDA